MNSPNIQIHKKRLCYFETNISDSDRPLLQTILICLQKIK